ncbi:MAG TPA: DnaJ domain-containing protein [Acidimicrobiales bacterium]|nr:DnaJ domain-containing protein [Acidimicrobiales bacterium]
MSAPEHRPDPYAVLGVPETATATEIRAAYRAAARRSHPDAGGSAGEMQQLNIAWHVLQDPGRRAAYDRSVLEARRGGARPAPAGAWAGRPGDPPEDASDWFDLAADLLDTAPVRQVQAPEGWWALAPPAMLLLAVGMLLGAFFFASPALLVFSGLAFFLALGLFILAPLRAMTRPRR